MLAKEFVGIVIGDAVGFAEDRRLHFASGSVL